MASVGWLKGFAPSLTTLCLRHSMPVSEPKLVVGFSSFIGWRGTYIHAVYATLRCSSGYVLGQESEVWWGAGGVQVYSRSVVWVLLRIVLILVLLSQLWRHLFCSYLLGSLLLN
jgi:nitric oxide reductase large subunit